MRSPVAIGFRTAVALAETGAPPAFAGPNPNLASFVDEAFDAQDVGTLLQAAIDAVNALRCVPCQNF